WVNEAGGTTWRVGSHAYVKWAPAGARLDLAVGRRRPGAHRPRARRGSGRRVPPSAARHAAGRGLPLLVVGRVAPRARRPRPDRVPEGAGAGPPRRVPRRPMPPQPPPGPG